jgi:zinc protease
MVGTHPRPGKIPGAGTKNQEIGENPLKSVRTLPQWLLVSPLLAWAALASCPARAAQNQPAPSQNQPAAPGDEAQNVTRTSLSNGMQVVIIRNTLAPVATVQANFLVGGNETADGFPGMAHAQEHMAFRGCSGMTADQTAAIFALLGGENNADTQQTITQYFETVPATDVDVALEAQAACLKGVDDSDAEWNQERGAIEQEVQRDLSNPTYKFVDRLNGAMFADTPYAHDPLGTKASFDATTGAMLKNFYSKWYSPSDLILIVVGDVDPAATIAKIKDLYGGIASHPLPPRPQVDLQPFQSQTFSIDSNLPYVLGFIAYRFPGTDSPDYAAIQILADVLGNERADLYGNLVPTGKALATEFGVAETYPKASVGYGVVALPANADATNAIAEMRQILDKYATDGVPEDLVDAAKRAEIAQAEFERNSIPGLADVWSNALAAEGRSSPEEDVDAIRKVTLQDVNRVAKQYLLNVSTITATLKPVNGGGPVSEKGFGGSESVTSAPTKPVVLPDWAKGPLEQLQVPSNTLAVSDTTLANGIRLIVRTDSTTPTVTVLGEVKHEDDLETPQGEDGVAGVLDGLYSYGTQSLDRLAFAKALDDIAANENAGFNFSLTVLKEYFSRGVELLADNELHPALPENAFLVTRQQTAQYVAGRNRSPGYQTSRALTLGLVPAGDPTLREITPDTVTKLTLDNVKQYHDSTVRPDLTTIVVIGDVTADEAKSVIEKSFGDWKATGDKPDTELKPIPVNQASASTVPDPEAVQDQVTLAEQLNLNRFDPDYYPLELGNHVLGGGFYATRLFHDLRQVNGYVYDVDVSLNAGKTRASYTVDYGSDPQNVSKARALIVRDLEQMRTQDVSDGELRQAKTLLLRQIPLSTASEESVARGLLNRAVMGLPLDEPVRSAQIYMKLTADDVKNAFAKQIRTDNLVQVVRGPAPQ